MKYRGFYKVVKNNLQMEYRGFYKVVKRKIITFYKRNIEAFITPRKHEKQ